MENPLKILGIEPEQTEKIETPEIFNLLHENAPIERIVEQIISDFYGPQSDMERVFLGIQGLADMGSNGQAALEYMSKDSGELGSKIKDFLLILKRGDTDINYQLEQLLGIKRITQMTVLKRKLSENDLLSMYHYALERGYFKGVLDDFSEKISSQIREPHPQLSGMVEKEIISISSTLGAAEPSYFEMLGPRRILEMKKKKNMIGLLLGSLGKYSADEFAVFLNKINPKAKPVVVDNNQFHIRHYSNSSRKDISFSIGDGLKLPIIESGIDLIVTNDLIHNLTYNKRNLHINEFVLENLFKEISRVLKVGGKLLLFEQNFIPYQMEDSKKSGMMEKILTEVATSSGLEKKYSSSERKIFSFRKDVSKTEVDQNGFAHYGDNMITCFMDQSIQMVFQK